MSEEKAAVAGAAILDFTDVKDGGSRFNKKRLPAGDYKATIVKVEDAPTKEKKEPQWLFTISIASDSSARYPYYCKLVENQLWKVRNLAVAAGLSVPKKKVKLDPNKLVGKTIAVTLEDDEYEGKLQSTIAATFPTSELDPIAGVDEDEDFDTPADDDEPKKKKGKKKKDDDAELDELDIDI